MIHYIHYKKSHDCYVLISKSSDETKRGYKLGLEIDCPCFDEVIRSMRVKHNTPFDITENIVTNENIIGFRMEFMRCMDVETPFDKIPYSIKTHGDQFSTVYVKTIESKNDD